MLCLQKTHHIVRNAFCLLCHYLFVIHQIPPLGMSVKCSITRKVQTTGQQYLYSVLGVKLR